MMKVGPVETIKGALATLAMFLANDAMNRVRAGDYMVATLETLLCIAILSAVGYWNTEIAANRAVVKVTKLLSRVGRYERRRGY